jgi:CheY-like chemotaxis protein
MDAASYRQRAVLVVEDDTDLRETIAELLRYKGFRVHEASNGREALTKLAQLSEQPVLILLDLMMPEMTGWELIDELKRGGRHDSASIFIVSAAADDGLRSNYPVVDKPIRVIELMNMVDRASA